VLSVSVFLCVCIDLRWKISIVRLAPHQGAIARPEDSFLHGFTFGVNGNKIKWTCITRMICPKGPEK
jgi:hypothetical protein